MTAINEANRVTIPKLIVAMLFLTLLELAPYLLGSKLMRVDPALVQGYVASPELVLYVMISAPLLIFFGWLFFFCKVQADKGFIVAAFANTLLGLPHGVVLIRWGGHLQDVYKGNPLSLYLVITGLLIIFAFIAWAIWGTKIVNTAKASEYE